MIDIDHFKEINDTRGHDVGDKAIQIIAGCLKQIQEDQKVYVSRYGGDEFIVLYLGLSVEQVKAKAIALREYVNQASKQAGIPMTIAQGITHHKVRPGNKIWDYTSRADIAMYYAKKSHPNAIMIIDKRSDLDHPLYAD
jgi:diguanylate cyclase (GGDEF)-like protein